MASVPQPYINTLTGVRAFAAIWVAVFHLYAPPIKKISLLRPIYPFAASGAEGVSLENRRVYRKS